MTFKKIGLLTSVLCFALLQTATLKAEEKYNWAQKIIMPIEKTEVYHNETYNFGRFKLATGPAKKGKINSIIAVEGKKSLILYKAPKHGLFEIFATYKKLLKKKGFEIIFACEKASPCGPSFHKVWYELNPFDNNPGWTYSSAIIGSSSPNYYIAARKKVAGNETYVSIFANSGWWNHPIYRVDVAQISNLDTKVIPASDIEKTMIAEGRAIFYGIAFDSGKSAVKTESKATLAQIAVFLKRTAGQFYVVGHTDDQGSLSNNMKLSQARANSVVSSLVKNHSVPTNKLSAHGAGPLAPVASNLNADGKALNRRVEIVQKLGKTSINRSGTSKSASSVTIPSVLGLPLTQAQSQLRALGLITTVNSESQTVMTPSQLEGISDFEIKLEAALASDSNKSRHSSPPIAIVKTQTPTAGESVPSGFMITLTTVLVKPVSPYQDKPEIRQEKPREELVPVPKVTGKLFFSGYKILLKQGFKIKRKGKKIGFIRKQSPAANTRVKKGSTITITIGR